MLMTVTTGKSMAQLREDLPRAAAGRNFGVLAVLDLKEKMREKGVPYAGEAQVYEICNPQKAREVLEAAPELAAVLPCRISVYVGRDGQTRLATVRPSSLIAALGAKGVDGPAREVEETLAGILEDAAR